MSRPSRLDFCWFREPCDFVLTEREAKRRKKVSVQAAMMENKEEARKKRKINREWKLVARGENLEVHKKMLVAQANRNKA